MRVQHPEQDSKKGAALIMVMLSGMLIVILGIGMLFFYQKQVERRMKLEFDIHRRLAAKSGFNLVQYPGVQNVLATNGVATYVYSVADNRPDIAVTIREALPIFKEEYDPSFYDRWESFTDDLFSTNYLVVGSTQVEFSTTGSDDKKRNELVFKGTEDLCWNNYPFGLVYQFSPDASSPFPYMAYTYIGETSGNMFQTNRTVLLAVTQEDVSSKTIMLNHYLERGKIMDADVYNVETNRVYAAAWSSPTGLYVDGNQIAIGAEEGSVKMVFTQLSLPAESGFSTVSNVMFGIGAYSRLSPATNQTLKIGQFEVRNPYKYEIYLSWTNRNRYLGTTNTMYTTNVLATVVDKTAFGNDYYFFDSFETVVP